MRIALIFIGLFFIMAAGYFRIVDGAAPWYIVWPAIISLLNIVVIIHTYVEEAKKECRMRSK